MTSGRPRLALWLGERWVPLAFGAFCLAVLAANGAMIVLAVATWPGLETADAFRKGIGYNAALSAAREQEALGWRVELDFRPTGARRGRVELRLADAAGRPLERAAVSADLVRPTQQGHDFAAPLDRDPAAGRGVHALEAEFPLSGVWDVRLRVEEGPKTYQTTRRIFVP